MSTVELKTELLTVYPKINRAIELLKILNQNIVDWKEADPLQLAFERSDDRKSFTVGVKFTQKPELALWSLLTGEILYNTRCALDHSIFYLAEELSGLSPPPNSRNLMFPITTTEAGFEKKVKELKTLSKIQIEIIRSFQPFVSHSFPQDSPLFHLHDLNNIDKHRYLHVASFSVFEPEVSVMNLAPHEYKSFINPDPVEETNWLVRIETNEPHDGPELNLNTPLRIGLREDNYEGKQLLKVIANSIDCTTEIAKQLGATLN